MVQSFASLTLRTATPEEFREALMGRILALASAHDLLTRSRYYNHCWTVLSLLMLTGNLVELPPG